MERELAKLAHQPLTSRQLRAAQEQLCGQIGISGDNSESAALAMAKQFAHFGTYRNIARLYDKIRAITAEELQQLATEIYRPEASTADGANDFLIQDDLAQFFEVTIIESCCKTLVQKHRA